MKKNIYIIPLIISCILFSWGYAELPITNDETEKAEENEIRKNGDWFLYLEDAYAASKESGKPIMANFTGSDWCGWCIRLKNEVFNKETFKLWADENVVLLELDYPRKKQLTETLKAQNTSLQQAFQVSGYPTIWVFNLDFDESIKQFRIEAIGKTGYVAGGPDAWIGQTNLILKKNKAQDLNSSSLKVVGLESNENTNMEVLTEEKVVEENQAAKEVSEIELKEALESTKETTTVLTKKQLKRQARKLKKQQKKQDKIEK